MTRVDSLEDALKRIADGERVVLSIKGNDIALLSVDDLKYLEEMEDYLDVLALREAKAEGGETIPYEQVRWELGLE